MKTYEITINGKVYQVAVKEIDSEKYEEHNTKETPFNLEDSSVVSAPSSTKEKKGINIVAPMPGTIISMNVQKGDTIKAGQVLCLLEAMKMENEIVAPEDGVITEVYVSKGAQVESDDILIRL